jgi:acetolactate synthase small subunit
MRIERHELRRFSTRTIVNDEHHAQRLRHILDAQSDVLDVLNAMTKVHIDRPACDAKTLQQGVTFTIG